MLLTNQHPGYIDSVTLIIVVTLTLYNPDYCGYIDSITLVIVVILTL